MGIFALGFPFPFFEMVGKVLFMLFLAILLFDIIFLYVAPNELEIKRIVKEQLSNGDENTIEYEITGKFNFIPRLQLIDEYPAQLQLRNCILPIEINF